MKIALFSDIHANLPALEAALADIDSRRPDAIYCLGDLVGYNVWPNEVIAEIRRRSIPTLAGNYDFGIGRGTDDCGCAYKTDEEKANGKLSIAYTNQAVGTEERAFLRTLPAHIRQDFHLANEPEHLWTNTETLSLLLVHGSPRRVNEYLFEDRSNYSLARMLESAGANIMCFGHTHKPYYKVVSVQAEGEAAFYRHAINIGSVGKPKDGDPRACYVMLTIDENTKPGAAEGVQVEFVRVPYDIERAATAVEQSDLPDVYAQALRLAK